jgi:cbb3-type cytochrome oxidase subunit 1
MNTTEIPLKDPAVSAAAGDTEQLERAYIDASTRVPVLMFYTSAIAWLIVGTVLAMVVSFKLHSPDLLSGISFLTWGRLRPAHMNVMVYGWASMAGMGTAVWLMARLCRTTLRFPLLLAAGAAFWNLGVLIGVGAILLGDSTGFQWLEFPRYVAVILFVAYTLMASWAVLMFRHRRGDQIYITQWYLLGAFLWFPLTMWTAETPASTTREISSSFATMPPETAGLFASLRASTADMREMRLSGSPGFASTPGTSESRMSFSAASSTASADAIASALTL